MDPGFDDLPSDELPDDASDEASNDTQDDAPDHASDHAPQNVGDEPAFDGADPREAGEGETDVLSNGDDGDADLDGDDGETETDEQRARTPGERWLQRMRPLALPALLTAGVLVLIVRARATLEQTPRFLVDPSVCAVVARPAWVSDPVAHQIALSVATGLGRQASLLDGGQLRVWADALSDPRGEISPWIESVERLEPRFPHQADVSIRVRKPVLTVAGDLLVAASGHVLGPGPVALSPAPLRYDGRLTDEDLVECAAAAGELVPFRDELDRAGVRVVSVGTAEDGTVTFTTDADVKISWGRSARKSAWSHLDLPPSERLGNLRQVLVDHPGLAGLGYVRIWTDRPLSVRRDA